MDTHLKDNGGHYGSGCLLPIILIFVVSILVLLTSTCYSKDFLEFGGAAGDQVHLWGSCVLTLTLQKTFDLKWYESAAITLFLGFTWEYLDFSNGILHFNDNFFDVRFDIKDFARDAIGVAISFPLRYKK